MARRQEEQVPTCNHVKPSGNTCESPALTGDQYCYFHRLQRERIKRQLRNARKQKPLELPPLEDLESIHFAIGDVLNAFLADRIDHKKAGLLLYGLQTAATTIRHCRFQVNEYHARMVRYTDHERVTLEQEIEEEVAKEEAAERRAAARAAKKQSQTASETVGCPTSGEVPDVGNEAADPTPQPVQADPAQLPEKKPATGISQDEFWGAVREMALQNANEAADEVRRNLGVKPKTKTGSE